MKPEIRSLEPHDWPAVKAIFLEGIATGQATFETQAPAWRDWDTGHLAACRLVVCRTAEVLGWAALSPVSRRRVYLGVAEVSVYVSATARGQGLGRVLLERLIEASEQAGIWTLQAGILPENTPSVRLHERLGFRLVGRHERIGQLGAAWRDVLLFERRSPRVGSPC